MDPLTHTLVGAALASTRLGRGVPYTTATLVLAANAPDVDVLAYFGGEDAGFLWRRGWSHGPLGILVLPVVLVLLVAAWHRWRGDGPGGGPPWPRLLGFAYLGALTHPALDWLNTYGIRLLSPFSPRWTYGDTLFIVDPWLWLLLGGGLFLAHSSTARAVGRWAAIAVVASLPILLGPVPAGGKLLWGGGLVALALLRFRNAESCRRHATLVVSASVLAALGYVVAMLASTAVARSHVLAELERRGIGPVEALMVGPLPATPFEREVVAQLADGYRFGVLRFTPAPRLELVEGDAGHRPKPPDDPVARAALADPSMRGFVGWARFPFVEVERRSNGSARVWVLDARYTRTPPAGGRGFGAALVELPRARRD